MTLHDLSNAPFLQDIAPEVADNERRLLQRIGKIESAAIHMKSTCVFNMVNTSLVLGLCPTDEVEYNKLMKLYDMIDEVKPLNDS
uniref:hypothetical protein n=1 Tax=Acetatifactor sp. TaxID=1872090 RepID=UPI0040570B7A